MHVGELHDGVPQGWGRVMWPGGAVYEGEFRDGKPYGYGVLIAPDGQRWAGGNMGRIMALGYEAGGIGFPTRPVGSAGHESEGDVRE